MYIRDEMIIKNTQDIDHPILGLVTIESKIIDTDSIYMIVKRQSSDHYSFYQKNSSRCTSFLRSASIFKNKEIAELELNNLKSVRKNFKSYKIEPLSEHFINNWNITDTSIINNTTNVKIKLTITNELTAISSYKKYQNVKSIEKCLELKINEYTKNIKYTNERIIFLEKEILKQKEYLKIEELKTSSISEIGELKNIAEKFTTNKEKIIKLMYSRV